MSVTIRPVIETWGVPLECSSRETDIEDLIVAIAEQQLEVAVRVSAYGYFGVLYITDGNSFLDWLQRPKAAKLIAEELEAYGHLSADAEELQRQYLDIFGLCESAAAWRNSIDSVDGTLRIYCDRRS